MNKALVNIIEINDLSFKSNTTGFLFFFINYFIKLFFLHYKINHLLYH
jgi:hypothetical protein